VDRELLSLDPLRGLKVKQAKARPQPCFTLEQVECILDAAGPYRVIFEILAFSGMRIGELVWLTWADVDFENGLIRIQPKDTWVPKHGKSRLIPMHERVRAVLESLSRKHRWVFTARRSSKYPKGDHQLSDVHLLEKLKKILRPLKIEGHLHTFRHFFISHCANSGVPPFQLIKWVGHADVSIVMHYYALRDEESLWTMKKLSTQDAKQGEQPQSVPRAV